MSEVKEKILEVVDNTGNPQKILKASIQAMRRQTGYARWSDETGNGNLYIQTDIGYGVQVDDISDGLLAFYQQWQG